MLNNIMHLDLCRLMVYMLNYILRPDEAKPVCYNFYISAFYGPMLIRGFAMGL